MSTANVTSSCSSASTLVDATTPALGGISVGFSTPRDAAAGVLPSDVNTAATCKPSGERCSQNRQCCSGHCDRYRDPRVPGHIAGFC